MIFREDGAIRLGGVTLPGLIKKLEVTGSALIEEAEVEGSAVKPKQAIGYEDAKITIELIIDETDDGSAMQNIERINRLFRKNKAKKPKPLTIISRETDAINIDKVLFKDFKFTKNNQTDQYSANLELWEYIPFTISASKASGGAAGKSPALTPNYQGYLDNGSRGAAPAKTAVSPANDKNTITSVWAQKQLDLMRD